jgi:hypothetical protein
MVFSMAAMLFSVLTIALRLVIGVVLVRKYSLTRDRGFLWLGVAVVIWPLIAMMLNSAERMLLASFSNGQMAGVYPFTLVAQGQASISGLVSIFAFFENLIGMALLMVAVLMLGKSREGELKRAG